ncbi:uncharacterized protein [Haliotis asinina]|uniref:uncharacterized protein n=1 Tax=Haliotis asinina TaxID=109174 RepID=UPI003531FDB2
MPLAVFSVYVLQAANSVHADRLYVRITDGKMENNKQSSVIRAFKAGSPIECGVECDKAPTCVSFNLKNEPDNSYMCVLSDSIPQPPTQLLTLARDTGYYEKYDTGYLNTPANKVTLSLRCAFVVTTLFWGRLCRQHFALSSTSPCFATDSDPLKGILITEDINDVMSDAVGHFNYGITQDQVIKVNYPASGNWTVDSFLDLPGAPGSQFQHFPGGIRDATKSKH